MTDWQKKFVALVKSLSDLDSNMGIYPAAVKGCGEHSYEQRDGYKNGWNAAVMEYGMKFLEAVCQAEKDEIDDDLLLLQMADVGSLDDGKLFLNMSDTWAWASADAEEVPADKIAEVAALYRRWGFPGLLYWVSEQNGQCKSEFKDINRFIEFVRQEEEFRKLVPDSTKRAYDDPPRLVSVPTPERFFQAGYRLMKRLAGEKDERPAN